MGKLTILGNPPKHLCCPKQGAAPNSWIQSSPTHLRLRYVLSVGSRDLGINPGCCRTEKMKSAFVVSYFAGFLMFQVLGNSVYTVDKHYSQLVVDHFLQKKLHRYLWDASPLGRGNMDRMETGWPVRGFPQELKNSKLLSGKFFQSPIIC